MAGHIRSFAALLTPAADNARHIDKWISQVREDDLPHLHAFTRGLERDHDAVVNGLTLPFHNGGTEGVNTKTKLIQETDVRPRRLPPPPPPHPAQLIHTEARSAATKILAEPNS